MRKQKKIRLKGLVAHQKPDGILIDMRYRQRVRKIQKTKGTLVVNVR